MPVYSAMNKLKINRAKPVDLASHSQQPSFLESSWHGTGSRTNEARAEAPKADYRFNNLTGSQLSSRPSSGYFSLSQQSSQPTLTDSQTQQQLSQKSFQSDPGFDNWRYGSRVRDFSNKRPRSPNRPAFPSYFRTNVKDGASKSSVTPTPTLLQTAQGLPQRTSESSQAKCTLTEVMEQRLIALDNCLNGIFGGLDGLQKNLFNVQASVKEAAVESDIYRQKEAVRQHLLQELVDQVEENRKNFVVLKTIPETVRDEMKKLQIEELSNTLKKIPNQIAEQITEMKAELLKTMKREFQGPSSARRYQNDKSPNSENTPESSQSLFKAPSSRSRNVLSQKLLRVPSFNDNKRAKIRVSKEDSRSKKPTRGKRCTSSPVRSTSDHRSSKENVLYGDPREEARGDGGTNAHARKAQENLAVSGTSGFRSKDPRAKHNVNQLAAEPGWITVRRSQEDNQSSPLEEQNVSKPSLANPNRDVPTQALLQKASTTETQCEPVVELINTEGDDSSSLVYLGSKLPQNDVKPATLPVEIIELSQDSLDETRLIRQRLKARRRRFHCL
ncbi:hypothetical protein MPTK1_2g22880 [Marchantia polymorpha subsp. ruderalis]|uniref:Uncharacterized protein n=1 Tax=Marchantia polymorpha TaxID=3197 RepID=A0A2R6WN69_MARPO|nr:hypothetical protein MARPO_0072s0044 [Marchantia polymorpha]BBN03354.1 hypothetical protein Mp_2g22880 [Marchantia polymorpha subsp. ruderalis]|eukprot:PTQ35298.1 hypothetical protein MARPO_0072s0044 [Marchantia polymorpha]